MAITYPLALPSGLQFRTRNWQRHNVQSDVPSPYNGKSQVIVYDGQWVSCTLTLIAMKRAEAQDWSGWLASLKGHVGTFLLGDPVRSVPLGAAAASPGAPLVKGGGQTGNVLLIDGCGNSVVNYLKRGDLVQLGTGADTRLHEVMKDASSNGSGEISLDIWPDLRGAPADNAPLVVSGAQGLFHLTDSGAGWPAERMVSQLSFGCKERLV